MTRKELQLRSVGNSVGAIFPKAVLDRLNVDCGDRLHVVETEDGILLTPYDPDFAEAMDALEIGMKQYRNALRELAK